MIAGPVPFSRMPSKFAGAAGIVGSWGSGTSVGTAVGGALVGAVGAAAAASSCGLFVPDGELAAVRSDAADSWQAGVVQKVHAQRERLTSRPESC